MSNTYAVLNSDGLVTAVIDVPSTWNYARYRDYIKINPKKYNEDLVGNYFYDKKSKEFVPRYEFKPTYKTLAEIEYEKNNSIDKFVDSSETNTISERLKNIENILKNLSEKSDSL